MNLHRPLPTAALLALALSTAACGSGAARGSRPAAVPVGDQKVVAVLRFENNTGAARYDNLGRGLAAMMISDLSVLPEIRLVERERLEELQAELEFQQSAHVDPTTAQNTGLMVGAQFVVTGALTTVEPDMLLDTRIADVETAEILKAAEVTGPSDRLFELQQELAEIFIDGLGLVLTEEDRALLRERQEANRIDDIETVLSFSRALCYLDAGAYEYAAEEMIEVRNAAPGSYILGATVEVVQRQVEDAARRRAEGEARSRIGRILGRDTSAPRTTVRPPGC